MAVLTAVLYVHKAGYNMMCQLLLLYAMVHWRMDLSDLFIPIHSLEGSKRRNALACTLTLMPTLPSYDFESAIHGQ